MQVIAGNETPVLLQDLPGVVAESDVPSFLAPYGYKAQHGMTFGRWSNHNYAQACAFQLLNSVGRQKVRRNGLIGKTCQC